MRRIGVTAASAVVAFGCQSARGYCTTNETIGVVTYNVLSPALARASYYYTCAPEDLDPSVRLERVKEKIDQQVKEGKGVICLQEVGLQWAGPLHAYFAKQGYHFAFASYGSPFSDHMGVAIAWDTKRFTVEDVEIVKVASTFSDWPKSPEQGRWESFLNWLLSRKPPRDVWKEAMQRKNQTICARLKDESGRKFVVGCYHMPCLFGSDTSVQVMNIHAQLVADKLQHFAGHDPYILLGDWNIMPDTSTHELLTKGELPVSHPQVPTHPSGAWTPSITPMRSAYAVKNGAEPLYTNHSQTKGPGGIFTGTLDYIWLSKSWEVVDVVTLPTEVPEKTYPTSAEPSDHLLLGATLKLA
eukprot:TRINITY_DN33809_c0_g1_i1.p1 TRINITY_DN33809_c0_g1~~TRINITY_DN33809_c0_g1_i1.p1  ORF type:complete len:366 (+),score=99.67 TRINITY_DN33809_c0_g1_i1:32-1099(+)